ncbi:hypothetical protein M1N05_01075 [Dehalococcoidales bacterium]|nr:hypothetical protein [Dehalococcoidales bacterium]
MTLIIGMYYLNGNEALIASDSRIMRGTEYTTEQKIAYLTEEPQVVIASSGLKGIESEITERTSEQQKLQRAQTLREIKAIVDEVTRELYYHYKGSPKPTFREDEVLIHSIYGGFTAQKPKLYCLHENGYSEPIKDYLAVGDGNRFANSLLRSLYYPGVSQQRALEICIHAIIQTSKYRCCC